MLGSLDELDDEAQRVEKELHRVAFIRDSRLGIGNREAATRPHGSGCGTEIGNQVGNMIQNIVAVFQHPGNRTIGVERSDQFVTGAIGSDAELHVHSDPGVRKNFRPVLNAKCSSDEVPALVYVLNDNSNVVEFH